MAEYQANWARKRWKRRSEASLYAAPDHAHRLAAGVFGLETTELEHVDFDDVCGQWSSWPT